MVTGVGERLSNARARPSCTASGAGPRRALGTAAGALTAPGAAGAPMNAPASVCADGPRTLHTYTTAVRASVAVAIPRSFGRAWTAPARCIMAASQRFAEALSGNLE